MEPGRNVIWQQLGAAIDMLENAVHHAAQLYLILLQTIDSTPGWIKKAKAG